MLEYLLLGLQALSSATGYDNNLNYDYSISEIENVLQCDEIDYYCDVYSIYGENRYLEIHYDDNYALYDKLYDIVIEEDNMDNNPYNNYKNIFKIYSPNSVEFNYGGYLNNSFVNLENDANINFNNDEALKGDFNDYFLPSYSDRATKIKNTYYFENMRDCHADNSEKDCAIVASQIILDYYDSFLNDDVIEETKDIVKLIDSDYCGDKIFSKYNTEEYNACNVFRNYLIQNFCDEELVNSEGNIIDGLNSSQQKELLKDYLDTRDIDYSINYVIASSQSERMEFKNMIMNAINSGRPIVVGGLVHFAVAYAYDYTYIYFHDGNGQTVKVHWNTYLNDTSSISALDLIIEPYYASLDNYVDVNGYVKNVTSEFFIGSAGTYKMPVYNGLILYRVKVSCNMDDEINIYTSNYDNDTTFSNIYCSESRVYYEHFDGMEGLEDSSYDYNDHLFAYPVSPDLYREEEIEMTDEYWKDYYFTFNFYVSANITMDVCTYYY